MTDRHPRTIRWRAPCRSCGGSCSPSASCSSSHSSLADAGAPAQATLTRGEMSSRTARPPVRPGRRRPTSAHPRATAPGLRTPVARRRLFRPARGARPSRRRGASSCDARSHDARSRTVGRAARAAGRVRPTQAARGPGRRGRRALAGPVGRPRAVIRAAEVARATAVVRAVEGSRGQREPPVRRAPDRARHLPRRGGRRSSATAGRHRAGCGSQGRSRSWRSARTA